MMTSKFNVNMIFPSEIRCVATPIPLLVGIINTCSAYDLKKISASQHSEAGTKLLTLCRQHFQMHFCKENGILIKISLKLIPGNESTLFHLMAWHQTGAKPLPETMMT